MIDDDIDSLKLLKFILTKKGFLVQTESEPANAVEKLKDLRPDIIILDIMMPGMTGFEFLEKIKNLPQRENIKVVVGSSRDYDKDRIAALKAGANDFIAKPYNMAELVLKLNNMVA